MFRVVLDAPRIPQNTGQIARSCHAMGCELHLVRPLGFRVDAASLRRAAVGYMAEMDLHVHASREALFEVIGDGRFFLVSKHGAARYDRTAYQPGDWLIFGSETEGLPPGLLAAHPGRTLVIPMPNPENRCLNLSAAAHIVLFEALRQYNFGVPA